MDGNQGNAMSVGDGIFGGLVFLGLVVLYAVTRDRWAWRRIAKWLGVGIIVPIVGIAAWIAFEDHKARQPVAQQELWDLTVGMDEAAVIFAKGEPYKKEDNMWIYMDGEVFYVATFEAKKVRFIRAGTLDDSTYRLPQLQGIGWSSSTEEIEAKFGKPDEVSVSLDQTSRTLSFMRYGVFFELRKNRVVSLGVVAHNSRPVRYPGAAIGPSP
jgi:hypothetical protein